jgi:hypothetical protein
MVQHSADHGQRFAWPGLHIVNSAHIKSDLIDQLSGNALPSRIYRKSSRLYTANVFWPKSLGNLDGKRPVSTAYVHDAD